MKKRVSLVVVSMLCGTFFCAAAPQQKLVKTQRKIDRKVDLNDTFGRTHFIVGYTPSATAPRASVSAATEGTDALLQSRSSEKIKQVEALFSPDDDVQKKLIELINAEQKSIKVAIYMFTDKEIAKALINAHLRGVHVDFIADQASLLDKFGQLSHLQNAGIAIAIYKGDTANGAQSNIMHNKFAVFACNQQGASCVWTGSFNFTKSGRLNNQENVVIVQDHEIAQRYTRHFDVLKKRCNIQMKNLMRKPSVKPLAQRRTKKYKTIVV